MSTLGTLAPKKREGFSTASVKKLVAGALKARAAVLLTYLHLK
jgi:hypothetical protein